MRNRPVSPTPRSRGASLFRRALTVIAVVALVAVTTPGLAQADPQDDLRTAQRKVDALGRKVGELAERYNVAKIHLTAAKRQSAAVAKRIRKQEANVDRLRKQVAARASSAYMNGPTDVASLVSAETPQDVLDMTTSLELLSERSERQLAVFTDASKKLAKQRATAAKALTAKREIKKTIGQTRTKIEAKLGEQKQLLDQLKERVAEQRERAAEQRASRDTEQRAPEPSNDAPATSGKVADVIAFAEAQLGKPYVWGADGPDSYDCSGLTMMAWRQAGVSLPHSSQMQYDSGTRVARSNLQPGDLVFFYNPISHVGIYVGGGKMIAAPSSGDVVKTIDITSSYYQSNYTGAVRPG